MNNFLKTAYTAGAQQTLVDFGVTKKAGLPAMIRAKGKQAAGAALTGLRGLGVLSVPALGATAGYMAAPEDAKGVGATVGGVLSLLTMLPALQAGHLAHGAILGPASTLFHGQRAIRPTRLRSALAELGGQAASYPMPVASGLLGGITADMYAHNTRSLGKDKP
ncbi:hypothetical protein CMI47_20380 [Candidatus Pacearchaeota archaeon]|nr:hypothetical protein [Candidatus Pacearchaeota archaeon]